MLPKIIFTLTLAALALPPSAPALADQHAVSPFDTAQGDAAQLTASFTAFFTDVLAGRVPSANLTDQMKAALTPQLLSQIDSLFASFGAFQKLQFLSQDTVQGYQRYHYSAVFEKGSQGVMFVVNPSGEIAGFFRDQSP